VSLVNSPLVQSSAIPLHRNISLAVTHYPVKETNGEGNEVKKRIQTTRPSAVQCPWQLGLLVQRGSSSVSTCSSLRRIELAKTNTGRSPVTPAPARRNAVTAPSRSILGLEKMQSSLLLCCYFPCHCFLTMTTREVGPMSMRTRRRRHAETQDLHQSCLRGLRNAKDGDSAA
jgi:hypothetical protein